MSEPRLLDFLATKPLALERTAAAHLRASGGLPRADLGGRDALIERAARDRGVAVIPVVGPLLHRAGSLVRLFGATDYDALGAEVRAAVAEPSIREIVLVCDSPGGMVSGCFDLVDEIYSLRGRKPMTALVDENATSAAYAIASAADRIVMPRTGTVGSIGVLTLHDDFSGYLERLGIDVTYITSGAKKADGNPDEPLSESARKDLQAEVSRLAEIFIPTAARNRRISAERVRKQEAGCFHGRAAIDAGLADEIADVGAWMDARLGVPRDGGSAAHKLAWSDVVTRASRVATRLTNAGRADLVGRAVAEKWSDEDVEAAARGETRPSVLKLWREAGRSVGIEFREE